MALIEQLKKFLELLKPKVSRNYLLLIITDQGGDDQAFDEWLGRVGAISVAGKNTRGAKQIALKAEAMIEIVI